MNVIILQDETVNIVRPSGFTDIVHVPIIIDLYHVNNNNNLEFF